ncbi:hypothetical protein Aocu_00230 [Acholeplasma oculi]|uniref:Uncharacterized protein n=1 Tax=Acholeplasma oculi TaxID=35623 RepID=A0A061AEY8_9MOLU|nr:hypothetical protein Aocu_00230 [Acholeplasma oculi]
MSEKIKKPFDLAQGTKGFYLHDNLKKEKLVIVVTQFTVVW